MASLIIITREGASLGFRLSGFETREVRPGEDPTVTLEEVEAEGEAALVCMESRLLEMVNQMALKRIKKTGFPVIVPLDIPLRWQLEDEVESPIARMIRRAIGYQIKIKK